MDFSKIREMHKQNKRELSRASLGGDEYFLLQQQQCRVARRSRPSPPPPSPMTTTAGHCTTTPLRSRGKPPMPSFVCHINAIIPANNLPDIEQMNLPGIEQIIYREVRGHGEGHAGLQLVIEGGTGEQQLRSSSAALSTAKW